MSADHVLDEVDLALVDALLIHPRISWERLAERLHASPVTLARRWSRLQRHGLAWVTAWPGQRRWQYLNAALIQVNCSPASVAEVAAALAELPYVATIEHTTGDYQLLAIIAAPSLTALSELLVDPIPRGVPVLDVRTVIGGRLFGTVSWRLGALGPAQVAGIDGETPEVGSYTDRPFSRADRALLVALGEDGRRSFTDLAAELDTSPQAVKRGLTAMQRSGDITFRCDLA